MKNTKQAECTTLRASSVFMAYGTLVALASFALLVWGRSWFPGTPQMIQFEFVAALMSAAALAAMLATVGAPAFRRNLLFWFAVAHLGLWVYGMIHFGGALGKGLPSTIIAVSAGVSFLLFCMWLFAEGQFRPQGSAPLPTMTLFGAHARNQVMSQYERKIRQAAAQEERNRLARDLHDSIKQQIFAIQTAAATAQMRLQGDAGAAREALDQIRGSAREAMTEMEVMLDQLRAEPLESTGLVAALRKLCESIGFRTGAEVEFKLGTIPAAEALSPIAAEATLRVAQEALANVARHARATHVTVTLNSASGQMELTVQDDGAGFDLLQSSSGMGTANMRARAEELGGKLDLSSHPEQGTTVKFSIPSKDRSIRSRQAQSSLQWLAVLLAWFALAMNTRWKHWAFVPALAYIAILAVVHYIRMARLDHTA